MSYGADANESFERAADLVSRIFGGAQPSDIPFERPTRYPFVVNLATAKSIGLEMPPTLVALADNVIEAPNSFGRHLKMLVASRVLLARQWMEPHGKGIAGRMTVKEEQPRAAI